jgi:2,3-bisphosphoglycerate-independent phosphoglycerate mutase
LFARGARRAERRHMKYIVVIGDGCADLPIENLGNKTPLEYAETPWLDRLSSRGEIGLVETVPKGVPAGSDTAILSIFGNDPRVCYTGRSPLEAAGCGMKLNADEISFRTNVVSLGSEEAFADKIIYSHSGGSIPGDDSISLMQACMADEKFMGIAGRLNMRFHLTHSFRHITAISGVDFVPEQKPPHDLLGKAIGGYRGEDAVSRTLTELMERAFEIMDPHPINARRRSEGLLPANCIWSWGEGRALLLDNFAEKYGKTAKVISAVPLVKGIGALMGVDSIDVPGATGELDTDYEGKADAAISALLGGDDMAVVHIEAPDECSHAGDMEGKLKAIENIDSKVMGRIVNRLRGKCDFRILYLSDHPTLLSTRTHDGAPVPYLIYDSRELSTSGLDFGETNAAKGSYIADGTELMSRLFEQN